MSGRKIVVMVRHGESEWSKQNRFCGWFDSLLSDRGKFFVLNLVYYINNTNYLFKP